MTKPKTPQGVMVGDFFMYHSDCNSPREDAPREPMMSNWIKLDPPPAFGDVLIVETTLEGDKVSARIVAPDDFYDK